MMLRIGKCCNPVPGDTIIGYITRGRGVSIHSVDCPSMMSLAGETERLVEVEYRNNGDLKKETLSFVDEKDRRHLNDIINSGKVEMMHTKEATLEEIFIKVTGRGLL